MTQSVVIDIDPGEGETSASTLESYARILRSLGPEVFSLSIHDRTAETLWLSEDFLLPEDHALVEECVSAGATVHAEIEGEPGEGCRSVIAIPLRAAAGGCAGAVRVGVDAMQSPVKSAAAPLEQRFAPLLPALAARVARGRHPHGRPAVSPRLEEIEAALRAEAYTLFIQPLAPLRDRDEIAHFEVLLRLRLADGSLVEAAQFMEDAASLQLLTAIDRWVVRNLLVWLRDNRRRWARFPAVFAVNLSMESMLDPHFAPYVESCVRKSELPPQALCFDVAARSAAAGHAGVEDSMRRLEALGCEVALGDFGADASHPGYLRRVPVRYFKISSALVTAAPNDRIANAMMSSIVHMAGRLGIKTVAERVESDSELETARELGVDFAQGYLVGRPRSLCDHDFRRAATN